MSRRFGRRSACDGVRPFAGGGRGPLDNPRRGGRSCAGGRGRRTARSRARRDGRLDPLANRPGPRRGHRGRDWRRGRAPAGAGRRWTAGDRSGAAADRRAACRPPARPAGGDGVRRRSARDRRRRRTAGGRQSAGGRAAWAALPGRSARDVQAVLTHRSRKPPRLARAAVARAARLVPLLVRLQEALAPPAAERFTSGALVSALDASNEVLWVIHQHRADPRQNRVRRMTQPLHIRARCRSRQPVRRLGSSLLGRRCELAIHRDRRLQRHERPLMLDRKREGIIQSSRPYRELRIGWNNQHLDAGCAQPR